MRTRLGHWFRISEPIENALWQTGLFSFDASVLLNIYAYSGETRDELMKLIEDNGERVRLPYQFGLEYSKRRAVVIIKQVGNYLKAEKDLEDFQAKHLAPKREHPHLSSKSLDAISTIREELSQSRREMENFITTDPYGTRILEVFGGKLGPVPDGEKLTELHTEAAARYAQSSPPGYMDSAGKNIPDAYGDYIRWSQLIEMARRENKGFVLVTDDQKEDWWLIEKGRTIGPRPELIEEFQRLTKHDLWIYNSENFLRAAKRFTNAAIRDEVIEEVTQRLASQRELKKNSDLKPSLERAHDQHASDDQQESRGIDHEEASSTFVSGDSAKPPANSEDE